MTRWDDVFPMLQKAYGDDIVVRESQKLLGDWVFYTAEEGGCLLSEAPVGTGKSLAYLIPMIYNVKGNKRAVVSTETTALQDQLVDKDLPALKKIFGGFEFRSLKGRSNYLCLNKAPTHHEIVEMLQKKLSALRDGERRDVERVIGRPVSDEDWEQLAGESDYCAQRKCESEKCYSSRARELALKADIVVTNHTLLVLDAEYDIMGDYDHLVVDEAHTLERVLIDESTFELSPYDLWKDMESVWKALDAAYLTAAVPFAEEADKLMKAGIKSIVKLYTLLLKQAQSGSFDENDWKRQTFPISLKYISGAQSPAIIAALEEYELQGPGRFNNASTRFTQIAEKLKDELETMDTGKRKVGKGLTACKRLARICDMVSKSLDTKNGIVMRYGVPYAVLADGWKAYKGEFNVRIRCVPLDVSGMAREALWKGLKSVTLVSGTLRDELDGTFNYIRDSLGLPADVTQLHVGTEFDYATNQLVYVTDARYEPIQVVGARYSVEELVEVLEASNGRALVLFTANAEMSYAAQHLWNLKHEGKFPHKLLVQERGVSKSELVKQFMEDTHSVLLGSKSFFTGVDFPGESCSMVVLAKFPLPQYNALCRAQIDWWRGRGYPRWYEREALQVFKQASGRLIRNETDRGVIAILDQRVVDPKENISKLTGVEITATGSTMTTSLDDVRGWLKV